MFDLQKLAGFILQKELAWILAYGDALLSDEEIVGLNKSFEKLMNGTPLPYVIGAWEFFGLEFQVNRNTLIPRPETELLVETALAWLQDQSGEISGIDVGTGTGCIPISIAKNYPQIRFTAVDISTEALRVAKQNVQKHGLQTQVDMVQMDLLNSFRAKFDLICSNPPYIPSEKLVGLRVAKHEPVLALDGGKSGLDLVERLLEQASNLIAHRALVLIEFEAEQGNAVFQSASDIFPKAKVEILKDLAGHDRLLRLEVGG